MNDEPSGCLSIIVFVGSTVAAIMLFDFFNINDKLNTYINTATEPAHCERSYNANNSKRRLEISADNYPRVCKIGTDPRSWKFRHKGCNKYAACMKATESGEDYFFDEEFGWKAAMLYFLLIFVAVAGSFTAYIAILAFRDS